MAGYHLIALNPVEYILFEPDFSYGDCINSVLPVANNSTDSPIQNKLYIKFKNNRALMIKYLEKLLQQELRIQVNFYKIKNGIIKFVHTITLTWPKEKEAQDRISFNRLIT